MITGIYEGQTLWYNNITFTNSGLPRTKYAVTPTLCSVSRVSSDSYWTNFYLTPLTADPDKMIRIYIRSDYEKNGYIGLRTQNDCIHTSWKDSVRAYNEKIEKKIQWYRDQLEEGSFNSYFQEPFSLSTTEYPINLNDKPGPIELSSLLLTAGKAASRGTTDASKIVGYIMMGSKKYGITVPWYPWEVCNVSTTADKEILFSLGYYRTGTIKYEDYGESIYESIYESKRDLLVDCLCSFGNLQEDVAEQVEKKIKKLEKLKILV